MNNMFFELMCNSVLLIIVHIFLNTMLTMRYSKHFTWIMQGLHVVAAMTVCELIARTSPCRAIVVPVSVLLFVLFMYRDRWWTCVFLTICYGILESIAVALFYPADLVAGAVQMPPMHAFLAWMPLIFATVFFLWLVFLGLRWMQDRIGFRELLMYAGFPISQFLLFLGWNRAVGLSGQDANDIYMFVIMLFCAVADIGLFASMFRVSRQAELETENRLLAFQIEAQRAHYTDITAQYESIRHMRHDIAKHIAAMDSLLASGRSEEAAAYVAELKAVSYDASLGICEHPVVDAFLHRTIRNGEADGWSVEASVTVPADISVSDTDLICTFGNLLDNAVEACSGMKDPVIRMSARVAAGFLVISMENPVGPSDERKSRIPGLARGVGLRVLEDLAEKYDGSFHYTAADGVFRAEITYRLEV